ncbi:9942_t:CDS:1, partial [Entrophospora sp. SA101]
WVGTHESVDTKNQEHLFLIIHLIPYLCTKLEIESPMWAKFY